MLSVLSRVLLFMYLDVQLVKKTVLFEHFVEDNVDIRFTISLGYTWETYTVCWPWKNCQQKIYTWWGISDVEFKLNTRSVWQYNTLVVTELVYCVDIWLLALLPWLPCIWLVSCWDFVPGQCVCIIGLGCVV